MYTEQCKTLMKEIKTNTNKRKTIPCSYIDRINIVAVSILCKSMYRFNAISSKISMIVFTEIEKINKIHMELQETQNIEMQF